MKLSIVATLYKTGNHVAEFYQRSSKAAQQLVGDDYEIVLVNDGSPNNNLGEAVKFFSTDAYRRM